MSVLSDMNIFALLRSGNLQISPLELSQIQPASVDLRLGEKGQLLVAGEVDPRDKEQLTKIHHTDISFVDGYALRPGETITALTLEKLVVPQDCNGKILGKNSLLMAGIEVSVAYINPGYSGHMPLLIKNVGPMTVTLSAGLEICQLELNGLAVPATRAYPERYNMEVLKDHVGIEGMSLPSSDEPNPLSDFLKRRIAELASSH